VINNTLYGMTGGQMAPTTLLDELTTTTPLGQKLKPFFGLELLKNVADKSAFIARGIVSQPLPLRILIKKAIENQIKNHSFSFVEVLSMCPVNWKKDAKESLQFLEFNMLNNFPIGEIK